MDEEQGADVAQVPQSSNKKMMILILALLVVLIGVVVAVAIYIIGFLGNDVTSSAIVDPVLPVASVEDTTFINLSHPINTNLLTGSDGRSTVITFNFSIGVNNAHDDSEGLISVIEGAEPLIRSITLSVLRDMTAFEVNSVEGSTLIANIILQRLQDEFQSNLITGIYVIDIMTM